MKSKLDFLKEQEVHQVYIGGIVYEMVKISQAEIAMENYTKQKLNIHGVSGKRPDCPYCMEPISERMIEEWTNWLRNAKAACANGAVDKTVRGGLWCECGIPNRNTTSSQCGTCFKPIAGISAGRF
jgi:hypothetical protein